MKRQDRGPATTTTGGERRWRQQTWRWHQHRRPPSWLPLVLSLLTTDLSQLRQHLDWLVADLTDLPVAGLVTPAGPLTVDQVLLAACGAAEALARLNWVLAQLGLALGLGS